MLRRLGLLLISLVSLYIISLGSGYRFNYKELPIAAWVIGEWYGEMEYIHSGKTYVTSVKIDFINSRRIMFYLSEIPSWDGAEDLFYGIPYVYEFTSKKEVFLKSRGGTNWKLEKDGNQLIIQDIGDGMFFDKAVALTRTPRLNRLLVFLMAVILIGIYSSRFPDFGRVLGEKVNDYQYFERHNIRKRMMTIMVSSMAGILGFLSGIFLLSKALQLNYFFFMGMPWGQFLILEVCFGLLLIGVRTIRVYRSTPTNMFSYNIIRIVVGMFLVGNSIYGTLVGIVLWSGFFIPTCSYTGICFIY